MGVAWKYWTHVRLEMSGKLKRQEIAQLKAFFQQQFRVEASDVEDNWIQRQLFQLRASQPALVNGCLRCYISHQILAVCADLNRKFQLQRYFTQAELWAYVLNDINPLQPFEPEAAYLPLAVRIAQSFQPTQSSLGYWTKRLVLQQKDLYRALASNGIYLASDWAILNHTTALQLQQRLSGRLSQSQLEQKIQLLASFHAVYRQDRLRLSAGQRCTAPTLEQLHRMADLLAEQLPDAQPELILRNLQALAREMRQQPAMPLDHSLATASQTPDEQDEFLAQYQIQVRRCLKQAIRLVFETKLLALQQTNPARAELFMRAVTLFFLDQMPMAQIAPLVGLQKQFQVTRLLNLNGLRADVRQQWLLLMQQELPQILQHYLEQEQLAQLEHLESLLEESIDQILAADRADCYSARRSESLFRTCLCRYLSKWQLDSA